MSKLQICATPIGNLGDISFRAKEALESCEILLAEDTRVARRLLDGLGIGRQDKNIISCRQQNETGWIDKVAQWLMDDKKVVLTTDAGTPSVSDPGGRLLAGILEQGCEAEMLPGPSAVVTAIMGCGLISHRFAFVGFLPRKGGERKKLISVPSELGLAVVIFESPYRIKKLLEDLHELLGERKVVVARELTKKFETFHRGTLGQELNPPLKEKGEFVVVVEGG